MANDLVTGLNKEFWTANIQEIFFKESRALEIAAIDLRDTLTNGDYINHPYISAPRVKTYTKGTAFTNFDVFTGNDQLNVATAKISPIYVDDIDRIQNNWSVQAIHAKNAGKMLNNILDQIVSGDIATNAASYVDAGDVGGSAGSNISMSVSNIDLIALAQNQKLDSLIEEGGNRFWLVGPRAKKTLLQYIGGRETPMGDVVGANGKLTNRFGLEVYYSNNNYYTATFTLSTNPSAAEYITINGAVLEFVGTVDSGEASTAYIGVRRNSSTAATTLTDLVYAINYDTTNGTAGTNFGVNDAANREARFKLDKAGVVATYATTYMTIVAYGDIAVSDNCAAADNVWSAQTSYIPCGLKGCVAIAWQKKPEIKVKDVYNLLGSNIVVWTLYGHTVWSDMKNAMAYAKIDASGWTA